VFLEGYKRTESKKMLILNRKNKLTNKQGWYRALIKINDVSYESSFSSCWVCGGQNKVVTGPSMQTGTDLP